MTLTGCFHCVKNCLQNRLTFQEKCVSTNRQRKQPQKRAVFAGGFSMGIKPLVASFNSPRATVAGLNQSGMRGDALQ